MNFSRVIDGIIDDIFQKGLNKDTIIVGDSMSTYHELSQYKDYITFDHKDRLMTWVNTYDGENNNYYHLIDVLPNLNIDDLNTIIFKTFYKYGIGGLQSIHNLLKKSIKSSYPQYYDKVDYSSYFAQNKSSIIEHLDKYFSAHLVVFFVEMCPNFTLNELNKLIMFNYLDAHDNTYMKYYRMAAAISTYYPQYINDLDYQFLLNDKIFDVSHLSAEDISYLLRDWVKLDNGMSKRAVDLMIKNNTLLLL